DDKPHWIWIDKSSQNETIYLRRTFELTGKVKTGLVSTACDNIVTLYVNGKQVLRHGDWSQAAQADVGKLLVQGKNAIAAECTNEGGPAAFILVVRTETDKEGKRTLISDESWDASREAKEGWREAAFDASGWKKAVSIGALGVAPWGNVPLDGAKS